MSTAPLLNRYFKLNNYTLLFGCEPGYTLVGDACYLYVGAPVTYDEAKDFCRRDNASLPFLQKYYGEVQVGYYNTSYRLCEVQRNLFTSVILITLLKLLNHFMFEKYYSCCTIEKS